jgi:hypothetical protein
LANKEALAFEADVAAIIDSANDHIVIEQFLDSTEVLAGGVVVKLAWATHLQSFMRALVIELVTPKIEGFLSDVFS